MLSRLRPVTRRRRTFGDGEDRQQFLVTALFIGAIALVVAILVGALALRFYDENLRAVARVGGTEIRPDVTRDRAELLQHRITREEGRVRQAQISGEIDAATMGQRLQELSNQSGEIPSLATEGLVDLIYQSQLAAERGIVVTDADIDTRMADELSSVERRRVQAIFIEPQAADAEAGPTISERRAALARAQEALAAVESGRPWAEVAAEYSSHASGDGGGEYGIVSESSPIDAAWVEALFALPQDGTTGVIAGGDGIYRIGRVTEILPRADESYVRDEILQLMSLDRYREFLRYEVAVDRLREQIVGEAVAGTLDQVNLAHIYVEDTLPTGDDEAAEGEVHYSEILYAPGDDVEGAPDLPEDDPLWAAAKTEADGTFAELTAITDPAARATKFAEIATAESDAPLSGEEGGDAGFNSRGLLPDAVGSALFDTEHQAGALIGPIRGDAGYYVLLFHERRGSPTERLEEVKNAVAQPNADFAALARQFSDADDAEQGGELGWFSREMLNEEIVEQLFGLEAGAISEPIELGNGHHIFKVLEKANRALDPDQISLVRASAFDRWYNPLKEQAEAQGVIVRDASLQEDDLDPGIDQGEGEGLDDLPGDDVPVDEVP